MSRKSRILLCIVCLSFAFTAFGQNDTIKLFNNYYDKSIEKLRDLYSVRGADFLCDRSGAAYKEVSAIHDKYDGSLGSKLGIIFYSYDNDSLRIWLLKNKQRLYYNVALVPKEQLILAETDLRNSLKVDLLLAARNAKNRSSIKTPNDNIKRKSIDESIGRATSLLFPENIAENLTGLKHLIIIPEFNISQFPWYVLKPFKNESYLIDSLSISLAPHLCNFSEHIRTKDHLIGKSLLFEAKKAVVVGNPNFTTNEEYGLTPLPAAEEEANEIAALFNTKALTGNKATLSNVLQQGKDADFFYFATHGYADLEKGLAGSFLAFTPDSLNATGLWNAKSIQTQKFESEGSIAVLSACQTGVGKIYDAGFIGIGRAFFKAGIDHTIMSLWSVDDAATKELMTGFIKILTTEPRAFYPASHLRKAILEFKKTDTNPAHWAPFMLFGFPY